ncbi:MAG: DUF6088 family protein [Gemmatimonadota bacterium]
MRLARGDELVRVSQVLYLPPVQNRFGVRPPYLETALAAVAQATGETVVPHGATAANMLGLSQQVPVQSVFLASGRVIRRLHHRENGVHPGHLASQHYPIDSRRLSLGISQQKAIEVVSRQQLAPPIAGRSRLNDAY